MNWLFSVSHSENIHTSNIWTDQAIFKTIYLFACTRMHAITMKKEITYGGWWNFMEEFLAKMLFYLKKSKNF